MCCFSGTVTAVSDTQLFARLDGERQLLAYQMSFESAAETAMILPLPVPPGSGDDACRFIDLSGYPGFFSDLDAAFQGWITAGVVSDPPPRRGRLLVHRVGAFEASFVPTLADFERVDPRFRLAPAVWAALPRYRDWGFAVFRLHRPHTALDRLRGAFGWHRVDVLRPHPMAFAFRTRLAGQLFYPTVHVHDGTVRETAKFDHLLYAQVTGNPSLPGLDYHWHSSKQPAHKHVDVARAGGLVDPTMPLARTAIRGERRNEDIVRVA